MRLLVSGLLSRNATVWRAFARPKPAQTSLYNWKGHLGVMQTRMAHIVPPPTQPSLHSDGEKARIQLRALVSHFEDLFSRSPPDLPEQLVSTITQNPGVCCSAALIVVLYTADPLDASVRTIVDILPRTGNVVVEHDTCFDDTFVDDSVNPSGPFPDKLKVFATKMLRNDLYDLIHHPERVADALRVLASARFSASAIKNGLLADEPFIYAFTRYGLQLPASEPFEGSTTTKEVAAIAAVGACLQLITAGSVFMERHFAKTDSLGDIVAALEALKVKSSVDCPWGLPLIEKTIEVARANFANPVSPEDAWNSLFCRHTEYDWDREEEE